MEKGARAPETARQGCLGNIAGTAIGSSIKTAFRMRREIEMGNQGFSIHMEFQ